MRDRGKKALAVLLKHVLLPMMGTISMLQMH